MTPTQFARSTVVLALAAGGCMHAPSAPPASPVYVETSPGVYAPAEPAPAPIYPPAGAPPVTQRNPRLYRVLELLSEPVLVLGRQPRSGYTPTDHPFIDAAPNVANLAFLGLVAVNSTALGFASVAVPTLIRVARIALYGPPYAMTPRETRLWVLLPDLVPVSRTKAATGYYLERPLYQRLGMSQPLFPRRHRPGSGIQEAGR